MKARCRPTLSMRRASRGWLRLYGKPSTFKDDESTAADTQNTAGASTGLAQGTPIEADSSGAWDLRDAYE